MSVGAGSLKKNVYHAYHLLEGFPFIQEAPSGDLQERVLIRHHDYDQCFFFFSSRRRHTKSKRDWSSDVCSSDLYSSLLPVKSRLCGPREQPRISLPFLNRVCSPVKRSEERRVGKECGYRFLACFSLIQEPPSGDFQESVLIRHHDYDECFQSVQLLQWNSQVKVNVTVYRNLPTTRDSIMTS